MSLQEKYKKYKAYQQRKFAHASSERMLKILMQNIDFESTLLRLGISAKPCDAKGEYCGYCPDHEIYKGVPPSDPKWYINSNTGLSYCMTEARGSNLLEIAKNLLGLRSVEEAFEKLLDGKPVEIKFQPRSIEPEKKEIPDQEKLKQSLEEIDPFFEEGKLSEECVAYFEKDGITIDTLNRFGVVSCDRGKYKNRAIVPFLDSSMELVGFIGIDLLGRERWAKRHAEYYLGVDSTYSYEELYQTFLKKYKKTLYAPGFQSRKHLYGFYENFSFLKEKPEYLVLVEGERDAMKLMQEGISCLSIHGTYVKEEQRLLLKSSGILPNLKELFLGFDMDKAGNEAVIKASELFSSEMDSDKIFVLNFPGNKDPKKFCRKELLEIINESRINKIRAR